MLKKLLFFNLTPIYVQVHFLIALAHLNQDVEKSFYFST